MGQWPTIGQLEFHLVISGVIMDQTMVILKKYFPLNRTDILLTGGELLYG